MAIPAFPSWDTTVSHDGKLDLVFGQGHGYGLYWLEQAGTPAHRLWIRHTIDESFSQSHALALGDLAGDGALDLVTGKRYRGHSGNDPGSYDPVVIYAYRLPSADAIASKRAQALKTQSTSIASMAIADPAGDPIFTRIALSVNGTASIGTQIVAADFDHDGDMDLATAGKLGVHVLENLQIDHISKAVCEQEQPLNRDWPFPGEGKEIEQEDGPAVPK